MTFQVVRVSTSYNAAGTRVLYASTEVIERHDTPGSALAHAYALDRKENGESGDQDTVVRFFARHSSGRVDNVTEFLAREIYDAETVDRLFPVIELPF